jgi:hypothetical protein
MGWQVIGKSSYLHSACALLCLITAFISASAFLLASLIDSLLHVCHHALPYCPTPSHLSSYCPSHFPATCAPLSFFTASISAMSTLLLSPPPLFCMCAAASHKSVYFHCLFITCSSDPFPAAHTAVPCHNIYFHCLCPPAVPLVSLSCTHYHTLP